MTTMELKWTRIKSKIAIKLMHKITLKETKNDVALENVEKEYINRLSSKWNRFKITQHKFDIKLQHNRFQYKLILLQINFKINLHFL